VAHEELVDEGRLGERRRRDDGEVAGIPERKKRGEESVRITLRFACSKDS